MIKNSEIFIIPSEKLGDFYFCPLKEKETSIPEPAESLLAIEFEKMLSPSEGRKVIARIHSNNIIQMARENLKSNRAYIHSCREGNYVFFINGLVNSEADARKLAKNIEAEPNKFPSNDIFSEKL